MALPSDRATGESRVAGSLNFIVPDPGTRVPPSMYMQVRAWLLENDPDMAPFIEWSQSRVAPDTPERLAMEIIWIILCAGRSAQAARTIESKVQAAIAAGQPVVEVFGYRAKAAAIERAWRERDQDFAALQLLMREPDPAGVLDWCNSIPFIGDDTKYQLAKNLGFATCKPDIWLCRLAGIPDRPRRRVQHRFAACMALCQSLSAASGDNVAVVDSVLWLAANKGVLVVSDEAGPVQFVPGISRLGSIFGTPEEGG